MWQSILDALFPRTSLSGQSGAWITEAELGAMQCQPIRLERDVLRSRGIMHLDSLVAAGEYDSVSMLKKAILTFKYQRIPQFADALGSLLLAAAPLLVAPASTVLCSVPLHWTRQFTRGFNQSDLLALHVAGARGWQVVPLLRRTRRTGHQAHRRRAQRIRAMQGAFALESSLHTLPNTVVLVDDVCTTGATLDACASALKSAGIAKVDALVIALG